jgi:hypothetical protein
MRVVVISLLICALSFAAGVAGDLSLAAQPALSASAATRIVIPADAIRAHPLPPLPRAAVARNRAPRARTIEVAAIVAPLLDKPGVVVLRAEPKPDPQLATKAEPRKDVLV